MARAWLLNFDAEHELADPSARTPSRAVIARSRALADRVLGLLGPGDVIVEEGVTRLPEGFAGRAWCPTPRALAALASAGARVAKAPELEVLRRVNHRRFSASLGQTLPGARWVTTRVVLEDVLASRPRGERWILKRPFGFAGRGKLRIAAGAIDDAASRWIDASFAAGDGLQAEPWMDRTADFALHGYLHLWGKRELGEPTWQHCDENGAWKETSRAGVDLRDDERAALVQAAEEAAEALYCAGYFGPFGVDAFRYRGGFNPRCEINARYSMGWAIGMGENRPDL